MKYAPTRGRYKVYIIDEVHQLTEAAFNALLKTLEEPPPHVVFILATTDPRDIPATVLSRVQRFDFRPMAPDVLASTLERVLVEEKIPFDPAALPPLVRAASGSLRDALSLLDTAIAYGDGRLEADTAAGLLGTTTPAEVKAYAAALVAYDTGPALEAVDRAAREGEDLHAFIRDVIETLRVVLVLKAAPTTKLADLTATESNELRKLGEAVSLDEILFVLRALLDADEMMRESPHPRVELEIATVRATRRPVPHALEEVLRRVDEAEARLRGAGFTGGAPAPAPPVQQSILDPSPESPRAPGPGAGPTSRAPRAERLAGSRARPAGPARCRRVPRQPARPCAAPASRRSPRRLRPRRREAPAIRLVLAPANAKPRGPVEPGAALGERLIPRRRRVAGRGLPGPAVRSGGGLAARHRGGQPQAGAAGGGARPGAPGRTGARRPHPRARGQPVPSRPPPRAAEPGHPRPGGAPLGDGGRALHHRDGGGGGRGPARAPRRAGSDGRVPGRDRGRPRPLAGRRRAVKGFGNIMKEAQKLQQQMEKIQAEVAQKKVEATAGGGMVTVEANGKQEIVSIKIDPEVVSRDDVQMLEDLVLAACNEALRKSREMMQQELGKLTGGLRIPGLGG